MFIKQKQFKMNLKIKFHTQTLRNKYSNFQDLPSIIKMELSAECFHMIYIVIIKYMEPKLYINGE
jgi:hypothetical protein